MSGRSALRANERSMTSDVLPERDDGVATALRDGFVPVELGVMQYLGRGDAAGVGRTSGWAEPEDGHNWNDGCETVFSILISGNIQGCTLEFTGEPFLNKQCQRQDVILHVNGFHVGYWRLTSPGSCDISVRIEPEQLFRRNGSTLLRCAWSFPMCASPAALGIGEDWRELAFCFRTVMISRD